MAKKVKRKAAKAAVKKARKVAKPAKAARPQARQAKMPIPETREIHFKIENIVASANLEVELDLYGIAREVDNVEYEPEQFPGAILKLKEPKTSLLLFKNGKLICTGAKSEADVEKAINKAYSLIKECIRR
jgi:TATA-box binding protein (TBP) (component of TFIID and TFIIIB)